MLILEHILRTRVGARVSLVSRENDRHRGLVGPRDRDQIGKDLVDSVG